MYAWVIALLLVMLYFVVHVSFAVRGSSLLTIARRLGLFVVIYFCAHVFGTLRCCGAFGRSFGVRSYCCLPCAAGAVLLPTCREAWWVSLSACVVPCWVGCPCA